MDRGSAPPPTSYPKKLPGFCGTRAPSTDSSLLQDQPANCSQQGPAACECSGEGFEGLGVGCHRSLPEHEAPSWGRWGCGGAAGSRGGPRTGPGGLGGVRPPKATVSVALLGLAWEGEAMEAEGWASYCAHSYAGLRGRYGKGHKEDPGSDSHAEGPLPSPALEPKPNHPFLI